MKEFVRNIQNLSKFGKKFIKLDLILTASIVGGSIWFISLKPNMVNLFTSVMAILIYYLLIRKGMWNLLERKEHAELLDKPVSSEGW